jgi:hypothetical protein
MYSVFQKAWIRAPADKKELLAEVKKNHNIIKEIASGLKSHENIAYTSDKTAWVPKIKMYVFE